MNSTPMGDAFLFGAGGDSSHSLYLNGSILGLVVVFVYLLFRSYVNIRDAGKYPPFTPSGLFETVTAMSGDDFPWFVVRMAEALQTRVFRLPLPIPGTPMVVIVGEPDLVKEILKDKDSTKPVPLYGNLDDCTSRIPSLFTTNGSYWHQRRKGVFPAFAANQVQRMNRVALETIDQWIEDKLNGSANQEFVFNVGQEMVDVLLTSLFFTAFEYRLSQDEKKLFLEESHLALSEFFLVSMGNPLRKFVEFLLPERRRARLAAQRLQQLVFKIMQSYRALEHPTPGTIIDLIMKSPVYKDDAERAADFLVTMTAGHDTTAYSLAWTLRLLAMNPTMQAELRTELAKEDPSTAHNNPFLKKCIRESLRLFPVTSLTSMRQVGRDFLTKDKKIIPKGSYVLILNFMMHRDPSIFGKTANECDPRRWDDPTPEMNTAFMPFSAGKQNYAGQSLANAELHSMLPRILSHFDLTVEDPGSVAYCFTLKPSNCILKATPLTKKE